MGEGNRPARRRQAAAGRTALGPASDGVSTPRVARTPAHTGGNDSHLFAGGAGARQSESGARGRARVRNEPCFYRGALPPGDPGRRQPRGISVGSIAERTTVDARKKRHVRVRESRPEAGGTEIQPPASSFSPWA